MADLTKLGRYELRRVLGRGAMGVVYEGFDPNLNRRVAVKTILRSAALDEETERAYSERFVKEAQAVGRLNHQNIVQVYDFGEQNEVAYIVMEFIEGRELRSFFEAKEKFTLPEAVRIMSELLDALDFAHEAGVIHRDIKPANVMLDAQRRVKLADFGVARVQDSDRSAAGTMVGTPAFMSPEQISGGKIDRRTDIFSAGVVFYQLLTGEQPFKGEGAWTVAKKIMQDDPPRPSELVQTVPAAFDSIVNHALAKAPAQRFARASEFASALRATQTPANQSAPLATPAIAVPRAQASEAEVEFWKAIQASTDAAEFEFYLEQFPDGTYAQLARHKIAKLKEPAEASRKEAEEAAKRAAEEKAKREAEQKARADAEAREQARKAAEEKARREAEERARREAEAKAKQEAEAKARREALEQARRAAEEKAKREAEEQARRAAEEKAKREAEEQARRAAAEQARREAEEKARREAAEKVKREAEEKKRQAEALARLKAQEAAQAKAKVAQVDEDATVAMRMPAATPVASAPPTVPAARKKSFVVPALIAAVVVAGGAAAWFALKRSPAPVPVAENPAPPPVDVEKIKRETEERIRREYAAKSAAEQAALAKAAAEKEIAEKQIAAKAAAEKAAAEKLAAEKAAAEKAKVAAADKAAAEKAAADKSAAQKAADKAAAEKAATEKLAAEKAAADKVAAAKAASDKAAAEKAAAEKIAAEKAAPEKQKGAAVDHAALVQAFAQRKGVMIEKTEPLNQTFFNPRPETHYVDDGNCPRGQIRRFTSAVSGRNIDSTSICISLVDERPTGVEPRAGAGSAAAKAPEQVASVKPSASSAPAIPGKPGWPSVGDRWVYEVRDADHPDKRFQGTVEIVALGPMSIREVFRPSTGGQYGRTWGPGAKVAGMGSPGFSVFSPFLRAFQEIRGGESWSNVEFEHLGNCSSNANFSCSVQVRVAGKERVSVRAGSFDTWKIVAEMLVRNANGGGGTSEMVFWYSEEAKRTVKSQFRNRGPNGPPSIDSELVSYTPAGK